MSRTKFTLSVAALVAAGGLSAGVAAAGAPAHAGTAAAHLISHSREAVPFIADDYAGALAAARARHVPIFVEAWAPW